MHFNRVDICNAYSYFIDRWRWGFFNEVIAPGDGRVREAAIRFSHKLGRIQARGLKEGIHFFPGLSGQQPPPLTRNAKAIYAALVKRHLGVHSTKPACKQCCGRGWVIPENGGLGVGCPSRCAKGRG